MKVADIVREIDKREALENCILHGRVRGIVNSPNGFESLSLSSGDWAVLELYAITLKGENYFGFGETTFLTPESTVLFVLEDKSLIGKLVTVSGNKGRGIKLRRQKGVNNRLGYFVPVFSKHSKVWSLEPNTVKLFEKTTSKEIDLLFKEYEKFGPYYLAMTKSVVGFDGSSHYNFVDDFSKVSSDTLVYPTDFTQKVSPSKEEELSLLLDEARRRQWNFTSNLSFSDSLYESAMTDFVKSFNKLRRISDRLIPETTSRFKDIVTKKVSSYSEALALLLGVEDLEYFPSKVLIQDPFYYYLNGQLDFDTAEKIFFISTLLSGEKSDSISMLRGISVIVEGAKRAYERRGHSMLLNSLSTPLTCKVSEPLISLYKKYSIPLDAKTLGVVKYLGYTSYSGYKSLYNDGMYYTLDNDSDYLSLAISSGYIVEPKKSYYSEYKLAKVELELAQSASDFASVKFDYEMEDIQPHIDFVSKKSERPFNTDMLRSLVNLNTGLGIFLGTNQSRLQEIQEVILRSVRGKGYLDDLLVIDSSFAPNPWFRDYENTEFMHISHISYAFEQGEYWGTRGLVFVNNAHTMSTQELNAILEYVDKGSAVYLFGSPWSGVGVLRSLSSKYSSAVVLPEDGDSALESTLATVNSDLKITVGNNLKLSDVPTANTLLSLRDVLKRTFEAGLSRNDVRVVSDLKGSASWESLGERLLRDFTLVEEDPRDLRGTLVFSKGSTYELNYNGDSVGSWSGVLFGTIESYDEEFATINLGDGTYTAKVRREDLNFGYCVPSDVAELYPVRVSFVVCQRNRGQLVKESIVRSLNSASGVSFIGDTSLVVGAYSQRSSLPVTLINKVL